MNSIDLSKKMTIKTMTRADGERYRKALEQIRDHMEIAVGHQYKLSSVWNIANNSLENEK